MTDVGCDQLLFQHFAALTERFLAPLNRYFTTLATPPPATTTPTTTSFSSPSAAPLASPRLPQEFHPPAFLASLATHGSPIAFRGAAPQARTRERFYARFLGSPQFARWVGERGRAAGEAVRGRWLGMLEGLDCEGWLDGGREEGEVEEMVRRLEREAGVEEERERERAGEGGMGVGAANRSVAPAINVGSGSGLSRADSGRGGRLRSQADRLRELRRDRLRVTTGSVGSASELQSASPGVSPVE